MAVLEHFPQQNVKNYKPISPLPLARTDQNLFSQLTVWMNCSELGVQFDSVLSEAYQDLLFYCTGSWCTAIDHLSLHPSVYHQHIFYIIYCLQHMTNYKHGQVNWQQSGIVKYTIQAISNTVETAGKNHQWMLKLITL